MKPIPLLDLSPQFESLREEITRAIREVVESQQFILGPGVERFEQQVAQYTRSGHAIGCASGTDALILALAALDLGPGDQVLTSPFSFFASASCAYKVGARPVFADIEPESFNMDPERIEAAMTPTTRALMPVHLFGQCAEMGPLMEIADRHGIPVVEDAAQALGSTCPVPGGTTAPAGSVGQLGCFSFFPSKNLGGFGDGGMVVTSDEGLAERLRMLRVHGASRTYTHRWVGWNSRLDALQAAVLGVKLPHLDGWSKTRAENADRYDLWFAESGLTETGAVKPPPRVDGRSHIFNQYTLRVERRDELREHLRKRDVGHSVYYPIPLHLQECFSDLGYRKGDFPVAEQAAGEVISIPIYPGLPEAMQRRVVDAMVEFYRPA